MESRPFPTRDGDVLQLGVDYQGGTEEIYRCVKMRIELNRGWQRGANSFNTNALRQIRGLDNVSDQRPPTAGEESKSKKKKHRKHKTKNQKNTDAAFADYEGDEGTASDGMQVDKKEKKKTEAPPSGVTNCCIFIFSTLFRCIRPLLMQHHPGFSCPLCRTFGDLEADVEQDDVPEPVEENSSSSSGESDASEEEVEDDEMEGIPGSAPALPDKDTSTLAPASIPSANAGASSENTAVLHSNAIQLVSSDPNLDTLRPGRKSPLLPSASHFGSSSSTHAQDAPRTSSSSTRPSLDVARPPSGTRTPPSRGSRVASFQSVPPSGAAVTAAFEGHTTPNNQNHGHSHHSHYHSAGATTGEGSFNPPSAGDFDPDIRRGSIYVHGADGQAMDIAIIGRSRPGSVHEGETSTAARHDHNANASNTQSPSVSAAEKNKARSARSMRMTKSKGSTNSLRHAAAASAASGGTSSATALERRARSSVISSDEEDVNMDGEEPLTATHAPSAYAHFGTGVGPSTFSRPQEDTHMSNGEQEQQDTTLPCSHQEYSETASDVGASRGQGNESRRHPGSLQRDMKGDDGQLQDRQAGPNGNKQTVQGTEAASASVHAIV